MSRRFARSYAKALLANLTGDAAAKSARNDLARFAEALGAVPALGRMSMSPSVPPSVKASILDTVCEKLEVGASARGLLQLLVRNFRLPHLAEVIAALDDALNQRAGIVTAEVTAARPLDAEQLQRLEQVLAKALDRKVDLSLRTDPKLLAGFVARIGSQRYDASLSGQLDRLASRLTADN